MNKSMIILSALCMTANMGVMSQTIDELDIKVTKTENREYSFTDKKSGFWYGRTHQDQPVDWYAGWNVAKKHVLSDYALFVDGKRMKRVDAMDVTVNPLSVKRQWNAAEEELMLLDNNLILVVNVNAPKARNISLSLTFPDDADKDMVGVYALDGTAAKKTRGQVLWIRC